MTIYNSKNDQKSFKFLLWVFFVTITLTDCAPINNFIFFWLHAEIGVGNKIVKS